MKEEKEEKEEMEEVEKEKEKREREKERRIGKEITTRRTEQCEMRGREGEGGV